MRLPMGARIARRFALVIAFVLVVSACDHWQTLGYSAARTSNNPFESTLSVGNVEGLQEAWSAADGGLAPPVVSGDYVFVLGPGLRAYSADGTTNCSGTPKVCEPLWSATGTFVGSATVARGVVYATSSNVLHAYDARGMQNCAGTPKICSPLWTAPLDSFGARGAPAVANGLVFVGADKLYAFDAAGRVGCTGFVKVCKALWTAASPTGAIPAVSNGVVYVARNLQLLAYDANGATGCSGIPKTCAPLWTHTYALADICSGGCGFQGPPSIIGNRLYVIATHCCQGGQSSGAIYELDATGQQGCSGSPKTCQHLDATGTGTDGGLTLAQSPIAIANGVIYASDYGLVGNTMNGLTLVWKTTTTANQGDAISSPTVANGVVYALSLIADAGGDVRLAPQAYDATGQTNCSGTPKVCAALWTGQPTQPFPALALLGLDIVGPAVANGTVYVRTDRLRAYTLP